MKEIKHYYLHVDLDAFFASVEQLDHPEYKGKPLIVGGLPGEKRSVVSTASYEARKFGVHSAMPVAKAYQLCPQGIYVHGNMKRYAEISYQIMNIFRDFSPDIQQISIDEAFIDLTGTEKLFGPPQETAYKIKKAVKEQTGLTVSVGLAPTKYLAKIASDMNKPDGFYSITEGQEEAFMLNLPLKKVWGIGDKTLEALKAAGLRTTRDIHEKSREALIFMFGENTGSFLYNVVRGIEAVDFDRKTKSHSISNETTFPYDVTDSYTAETTILELCHSVMFRLLREKGFSKTVMVKIRYEDFTTVSVQQTYSDYVLTLDSLYSRAKELFERRYENGRGIRLLGIALENIDTTQKPSQQSLFDDGTEKKQKVESAILNLEKKHPEIKIHKARMLQKISEGLKGLLVFVLGAVLFGTTPARLNALEESSWNISGYWKGDLTGSLDTSFGYSNPFGFNAPLPVFKQEVDLSAFIQITPSFYFSMEFLDDFKHNSWTLGYKGTGYLKEFKLSNRDITFPSAYSSSLTGYGLGGGNNQAPGIMLHFEDPAASGWKSDILLRYDMIKAKSATFYGNNRVNQIQTRLDSYLNSYLFYIPSDVISLIDSVYIQDSNGSYTDSKGIKLSKLLPSDYVILAEQRLLLITNRSIVSRGEQIPAAPYIVITFSSAQACQTLFEATGSYDDESSFAGKVNSYFGAALSQGSGLKPDAFSILTKEEITTQIKGQEGFVIQSPDNFLPFACCGFYQGVKGSEPKYAVIDSQTGKEAPDYYALPSVFEAFGDTAATAVFKKNTTQDFSNPAVRYPFADLFPDLYLYKGSQTRLVFSGTTTSPVKNFDIGKFVQSGSVQVYKNGIPEPAVYDSGTGFVTLSSPVTELDKIYITWYEESNEPSAGAFAAAAGFMYNFTPELLFDVSFTGLYPFIQKGEYASSTNSKQSFSALTAGLTYQKGFLFLSDTISTAWTNPNMTGIFVANKYSDTTNQTFYLTYDAGLAIQEPPASQNLSQLKTENNYTVNNFQGQQDKKISGYKIPVSYDFSGAPAAQTQNLWAGAYLTLNKADSLYKADEFEMAFLPGKELAGQNCRVFLMLGAAQDILQSNLPVWEITSLTDKNVLIPLDLNKAQWQTVRINITPQQRAKLCGGHDARLIIVKDEYTAGADNAKATLYAGPYSLLYSLMQLNSGKSLMAQARLYNKNQADLQWTFTGPAAGDSDKTLTSTSYFESADFSLYKSINLDFTLTSPAEFTLELEDEEQKAALSLMLKPELTKAICGTQRHTLSVNIYDSSVSIDGASLPKDRYQLSLNKSIIPCIQTITIIPQADGTDQQEITGHIYISKLYYKDADSFFETKNLARAKLSFKDGQIQFQSEQALRADKSLSHYINTSVNADYTLAGIKAAADADINLKGLINAGHSLQTQSPLFNFLDFGELYRYSFTDSQSKKDYIKIDTKPLFEPFSFMLSADTFAQKNRPGLSNQQYKARAQLELDINKNITTLGAELNASQKLNLINKKEPSYFYNWYEISRLEFSKGEEEALRSTSFTAFAKTVIPDAGLSPQLDYELKGDKNNPVTQDYTSSDQLRLVFPFTTQNNALAFNFSHKNTRLNKYAGINYGQDLGYIFTNSLNKASLSAKETTYELTWRRKLYNDLKDFFIPLSAGAALTDSKNLTKDSTAQAWTLKFNLTDSFINLFGANSTLKIFNWYIQEEFTNTLNTVINFTAVKTEGPTYSVTDNAKLLFNLKDSDYLEFNSSVSFDSSKNVLVKAGTSWTRQAQTSLLLMLTNAVWKASRTMDIKPFLKESFNFNLDLAKNRHKQTYEYMHTGSLEFLNKCSVTSGAGLLFGFEKGKAFRLSLEYSLGVKINF